VFVVVLCVCRLVLFVKLNKLSVFWSWGAGQKFLEWGTVKTLYISWLWIGIVPFRVISFRAYTPGPLPQPPRKHLWNFVLWCCPVPPVIYLNCKWHKNANGLGSVVGIATGYGLDGPGIESRWGARFSAPVQTGPGAHPASCTMGTGSFLGIKSGRGVTLTPHPLLVPWSWKSSAIPLLPLWAIRPVQSLSACTRVHFFFFLQKCVVLVQPHLPH